MSMMPQFTPRFGVNDDSTITQVADMLWQYNDLVPPVMIPAGGVIQFVSPRVFVAYVGESVQVYEKGDGEDGDFYLRGAVSLGEPKTEWSIEVGQVANVPQSPAAGRNGRWVKLGHVSVDGCSVMIVDPCYAEDYDRAGGAPRTNELYHDFRTGIEFMPGFGDGGYDVWGWVVDYGQGEEVDERVAQVTMTFIEDEDLAHWRREDR